MPDLTDEDLRQIMVLSGLHPDMTELNHDAVKHLAKCPAATAARAIHRATRHAPSADAPTIRALRMALELAIAQAPA